MVSIIKTERNKKLLTIHHSGTLEPLSVVVETPLLSFAINVSCYRCLKMVLNKVVIIAYQPCSDVAAWQLVVVMGVNVVVLLALCS